MDLSSTPFTHHGANQALLTIPYLVLIGMAIFLQYYQMKQMNSRNPQAAAANPQMQQMQKFFPIIFGIIYLRVPAGATIYMVVSSAMRIGTQEYMFRTGMVTPVGAAPTENGDRARDRRSLGAAQGGPGLRRPSATGGGKTPAKGATPPKRDGYAEERFRSRTGRRRPTESRQAPYGAPRIAESHEWQGRSRRQRRRRPMGRNHQKTRKSSPRRCRKSTHARDPRGQERLDRAWSG